MQSYFTSFQGPTTMFAKIVVLDIYTIAIAIGLVLFELNSGRAWRALVCPTR